MPKTGFKKGAALVDTLVYILILGLLGAVFINQLAVMTRWFYVLRAERTLIQSATLAIERIIRETRQAQNIDVANSIFNVSPGRLALLKKVEGGGVTPVIFEVRDGQLIVREGDGPAATTTLPRIRIDNIVFYQLASPKSPAVKADLTLSVTSGDAVFRDNFHITAVLRGGY